MIRQQAHSQQIAVSSQPTGLDSGWVALLATLAYVFAGVFYFYYYFWGNMGRVLIGY